MTATFDSLIDRYGEDVAEIAKGNDNQVTDITNLTPVSFTDLVWDAQNYLASSGFQDAHADLQRAWRYLSDALGTEDRVTQGVFLDQAAPLLEVAPYVAEELDLA
jgi:hypothetical protein